MLATILTILASLMPTLLKNAGVIGTSTTNLLNGLLGPVETLIANLKAGAGGVQDMLAVLAAMSGVVTTLKANTALPADVLTELNNIDLDIQAALVKYVSAEKGYDPANYQQIAPVA